MDRRIAALFSVFVASPLALAQGITVSHSGYLLDGSDAPVNATVGMKFELYDIASGGTPLWTGDDGAGGSCAIAVARGYFATRLGAGVEGCGTGLTASAFAAGESRWLEVIAGGTRLAPRQLLASLPTAQISADAQALKAALIAAGTLNAPTNPVDWTKLKGVPAGVAAIGTLGGGNQLFGVNAGGTGAEFKAIAGTVNRVAVTHGAGTITLSGPQDLHAGALPTFAGLTLTGALALPADPTTALQAATKQYVDAKAVGDITEVVAGAGLSGGASNGSATLAVTFAGTGSATTVARSDHAHAVTFPMWSHFTSENFAAGAAGWTNNTVTQCGSLNVLGGYNTTSSGFNTKTFVGLPTHTAVRIVLDYHFIDSWDGEYGLVQVDDVERWRVVRTNCCTGAPGVCGSTAYPDVLGTTVEIEVPHTASSLKVAVGSNLDSAANDESYAFSNFRVYTRN